ncbi:hypothetical protein KKA47_01825 [bacterium]|nr:hypothetical protein [bacterium]
MNNVKREWWEVVVMVSIGLIVAALVLSSVYFERQMVKQRTMFYQLAILRNSVNLYKSVNRHNPPGLKELVEGYYQFEGEKVTRRYVENASIDEKGEVVDPFGSAYKYNPATGWVMSSTSGFEFW